MSNFKISCTLFLLLLFLFLSGCTKDSTSVPINKTNNTAAINTTSTAQILPANNSTKDLWFLTFGGSNTDKAWAVDVDDEGVYLADYESVPGPLMDIYLYKLSKNGTVLWKTRWARQWAEQAYAVFVSHDRIYVGGTTFNGALHDSSDALVIAFDKNGKELWNFTFDQGYGYEEVDGLVADTNYIYVSGWTKSKESEDIFVLALDRSGKEVWKTVWGSNGWDEANGQIVVDGSTVYVAGRYNGSSALAEGDSFLATFDKNKGSYKWHKTWGKKGFDDGFGMGSDGSDLYVVGLTTTATDGGQIFLVKYDKNGTEQWSQLCAGKKESQAVLCLLMQRMFMLLEKPTVMEMEAMIFYFCAIARMAPLSGIKHGAAVKQNRRMELFLMAIISILQVKQKVMEMESRMPC